MIGGQIDGLDVGRSLGDEIDEAAGGGDATFDRGNALEEFDLLLVFERHILLTGNGHAVDLETGGEIERKTANLVVAVVAHGHVIVADRGIVLHHVRKQARVLVAEQVAGDDGGRTRRLLQRGSIERAHGDGFGKIVVFGFAVHHDGGGNGRRFLLRGGGILRRRGILRGRRRWRGFLRGSLRGQWGGQERGKADGQWEGAERRSGDGWGGRSGVAGVESGG